MPDRLAKRGYDLIVVARNELRLNALAGRLAAVTGVKVDVLTADLASRRDVRQVELAGTSGMSLSGRWAWALPRPSSTLINLPRYGRGCVYAYKLMIIKVLL